MNNSVIKHFESLLSETDWVIGHRAKIQRETFRSVLHIAVALARLHEFGGTFLARKHFDHLSHFVSCWRQYWQLDSSLCLKSLSKIAPRKFYFRRLLCWKTGNCNFLYTVYALDTQKVGVGWEKGKKQQPQQTFQLRRPDMDHFSASWWTESIWWPKHEFLQQTPMTNHKQK